MTNLHQKALDALDKAQYAQVFALLHKAKVMNNIFNTLQKEFISNRIDANYEERLKIAINDAFSSLPFLSSPLPPLFLTHYLTTSLSHFIGRQAELKTLHQYLQAGKRTVLVNGLGGVGKTSLAQKYVQDYQNEYAHILWVRQNAHLINSFFQKELFDNLGLNVEKEETALKAFDNMLAKLRQRQGKNLLIIDNYEEHETDQLHDSLGKLFSLPANWCIVCTSRTDVDFFDETLRLNVLPAHEAIQLFKEHAVGKPLDEIEIDALLKMVGYHTLMTELLAKTYLRCLQFGTVGKMHAFLQKKGLQDVYLDKKIYVEGQATVLSKHLNEVFSLAELTEKERWLLKQWIILPTKPYQATDFLTWIDDIELAYENTLLSLTEKGWLQTEDYLAYTLHPFLQMFLHQMLKPTLPDCEKMWEYFVDLMDSDEVQAHPLAYQWTIGVGEAMVRYIDFTHYETKQAILWDRISDIYTFLGDYLNAIRCTKEGLAIDKVTVGEQHEEYATSLNNLAYLYKKQGNYAEALPLYQKSLEIKKEIIGKKHPSYATSLNNLALLYHNQSNYAEALLLYQESLQIRKEVLGEQHPDYAQSLNNLALLYKKQGNYTDALPLYQESLQIRKKVLGEKHPAYAETLHNIGTLYFQQGDYQQARTYLTEAYHIFVERLGEQHPNTQRTKEWLDTLLSL